LGAGEKLAWMPSTPWDIQILISKEQKEAGIVAEFFEN